MHGSLNGHLTVGRTVQKITIIFQSSLPCCFMFRPEFSSHGNQLTVHPHPGITSPNKKEFFTSLMAWLDFLAILPYFVLLFTKESNNTIEILRVLRLARVLRVFKLVRRSKKLLLIGMCVCVLSSDLSRLTLYSFNNSSADTPI